MAVHIRSEWGSDRVTVERETVQDGIAEAPVCSREEKPGAAGTGCASRRRFAK